MAYEGMRDSGLKPRLVRVAQFSDEQLREIQQQVNAEAARRFGTAGDKIPDAVIEAMQAALWRDGRAELTAALAAAEDMGWKLCPRLATRAMGTILGAIDRGGGWVAAWDRAPSAKP